MNTSEDQARLAQRFLASLRAGDIGTACIQIEALHDVTPPEPDYEFGPTGSPEELKTREPKAEPEAEAGLTGRPAGAPSAGTSVGALLSASHRQFVQVTGFRRPLSERSTGLCAPASS